MLRKDCVREYVSSDSHVNESSHVPNIYIIFGSGSGSDLGIGHHKTQKITEESQSQLIAEVTFETSETKNNTTSNFSSHFKNPRAFLG